MSQKYEFIKPEMISEELVSALYQLNIQLNQSNKELIKNQKELSQLYSGISHDLRSPVNAINNALEYLLNIDKNDAKEYERTIEFMMNRVFDLEQLINDALMLSVMSSTKKSFDCEKVNIGIFLEEFFYDCSVDLKYAKHNLSLEVPENFNYYVGMNCNMIKRVLDNLFSNALHYSREGSAISLAAQMMNEKEVLIQVTDTGFGIPKEHLDDVFKRSFIIPQIGVKGVRTRYGLGLAIVKAIVEKHNGKVWCESQLGKGSSFKFILPIS